MSEENVEVVRRALDAWNRQDFAAALELIDPDIEVEVTTGAHTDGTYHGRAGLIEFLTELWEPFEAVRAELDECTPFGDEVLLGVRHHARGRSSGAEVEFRHWQVCTVRAGMLVRWRNLRTRQEALEVAGLSE